MLKPICNVHVYIYIWPMFKISVKSIKQKTVTCDIKQTDSQTGTKTISGSSIPSCISQTLKSDRISAQWSNDVNGSHRDVEKISFNLSSRHGNRKPIYSSNLHIAFKNMSKALVIFQNIHIIYIWYDSSVMCVLITYLHYPHTRSFVQIFLQQLTQI